MSIFELTEIEKSIDADRLAILIVDDNEPDRVALERRLWKLYGPTMRVWDAEDGKTGLEILRHENIDVAFVDYLLPDIDGLQLLAEVFALGLQTSVIMMAGQERLAVAESAIEQGATDYLVKQDMDQQCLQIAVTHALRTRTMLEESKKIDQRSRQVNEELDHFVRALSHDMNANFMLLESSFARLKSALDKQTQPHNDIIAHVDACLGQSKQFLEDMVQLGKTGSVQMEPGRVDVSNVVNEVLFELHELIVEKGVNVDVKHPLPVVWCNQQRLKQIVTNLIRNALKHGCDPNEPRITISQGGPTQNVPSSEHERFVDLCIYDNGVGIDLEFKDKIFLPGCRLSNVTEDGSGMGLAIVKKIVSHYGGHVGVDLSSGKGMAVVVSLPDFSVAFLGDRLKRESDPKQYIPSQNMDHDGPHQVTPPARHGSSRVQSPESGAHTF